MRELRHEGRYFLGRDADRMRTWIEVRISLQTQLQGDTHETTEHEQVAGSYWQLSISGEQFESHSRQICAAGQIQGSIALPLFEYGAGWDEAKVTRLLELWEAHHLNDMRAGCAHQTVVYEDVPYHRPSLELTPRCPITGYKWGSAWLMDPPEVTEQAAVELLGLLDPTPVEDPADSIIERGA